MEQLMKDVDNTTHKREVLSRSVLASLESHIAVLDQNGKIMAVNDAWLRFGCENGATSEAKISVGINYLNVCQLAIDRESEKSEEAFVGIRSVLNGSRAYFEVEYPCHSPTEERWFLMSVMPLTGNNGGVVVSHKNVTELKKVQNALTDALTEIEQLKDHLEQENIYLQEEIKLEHNFEEIIGQSKHLKQALRKIEQVAPTTTTVLILGETGTGKELFARAIHSRSSCETRPLVKVNCATLPSNLIESELFGHEKGAFTGALQRQIGRFELADGGTIFLDEIGDLPLELQAKLLRVLQEGEFERLGNPRTINVDVRVLAATNRNLEEEVRKNRFRQDLYYRLSVYTITIPPLRERKEDIPLIAQSLVQKFNRKIGKDITSIPQKTIEALQNYAWPGNVRELENVIERAVINAHDSTLRVELPKTPTFTVDEENKTLEEIEREYILRILQKTDWRIAGPDGAAEILGMNPSTLRSRIQRLGIAKPWVRNS
jgi:formate hydrogenlyase transcriptional activator